MCLCNLFRAFEKQLYVCSIQIGNERSRYRKIFRLLLVIIVWSFSLLKVDFLKSNKRISLASMVTLFLLTKRLFSVFVYLSVYMCLIIGMCTWVQIPSESTRGQWSAGEIELQATGNYPTWVQGKCFLKLSHFSQKYYFL